MARKHVRALSCRSAVSAESHSDGQNAGYFLRTLWAVLLALGYSEPPLFIRTLRLLHGNSWSTTDHIHHIRQGVEASTPRWTFDANMREAAREALAILRHE
jgi:hypothetical protein